VITEDANNDGKLYPSEINGSIDVNITLPAGTKVGDTLTLSGAKEDTLSVTQEMIDNGYTFSVDAPAIGKELKVEATITDEFGHVSSKGSDKVDMLATPSIPKAKIQKIDGQTGNHIQTTDTTPTITGTCVPGAMVIVEIHSVITTERVRCSTEGTFSVTSSQTLAKGNHSVTVKQTKDGVTSEVSPAQAFKVVNRNTPTPTPTATPSPTATAKPTPSPTATVTPTEKPVSTPKPSQGAPVAHNDHATITHKGGTVLNVLGNDSFGQCKANAPIEFTQPSHGTTALDDAGTVKDPSDDRIIYVPEANYNGADSFTYTIADCHEQTASAKVNLDVQCASSQTSDGDALNNMGILLMMILTSIVGLIYIRREELYNNKS